MADLYREQVLDLEEQLSRVREEGDVTREAFKVCSISIRLHIRRCLFADMSEIIRRLREIEYSSCLNRAFLGTIGTHNATLAADATAI